MRLALSLGPFLAFNQCCMPKSGCVKRVGKGPGDEAMYKVIAGTQHVHTLCTCKAIIYSSSSVKLHSNSSCILFSLALVYTVIGDLVFIRMVATQWIYRRYYKHKKI